MSLGQPTIGAYRILEQLGRGGMGVVYRAVHLESGLQVALKTVKVPQAWLLQSIRREIHALARIRHPGVVRILDHGLDEGLPWYAMELVEGPTLRQHCAELAAKSQPHDARARQDQSGVASSQEGTETIVGESEQGLAAARHPGVPTPGPGSRAELRALLRMPAAGGALRPVLGVVRRLCSSLAFLHGEGIVHRDLKPSNVLVRLDGMPVLVDFGLASHAGGELSRETLRVDTEAVGTSHYMAPEQVLRQSVDARADLYSLGCILYELVTGQPPFVGKLPGEVLLQHLRAEPRPPSELAEGVPEALDRLVLRLLAKQARERLGHADDVAAALAELGAEDGMDLPSPRPRAYLYRPGFAGREQPLEMLRKRLDELAHGKGGIALVGGESGAGKTRLMVELGREAKSRGIEVLAGECLAIGGGPLEALRRPLQALCDRCQERGAEEAERLFGARGPVLSVYEPAVDQLPGLNAHATLADLPRQDALLRLYRCLEETLVASAASAGEVLLLDDLQWADELTLSFLEHLAGTKALQSVPVLILGTHRTEETTGRLQTLLERGEVERLRLGQLDEVAVGTMIGDMLALVPPPPVFSRFLAIQSEGSPFFVAEYLRAAVSEGLLWRDSGGRWEVAESVEAQLLPVTEQARQPVSLPLPRSLRELVGRRLHGLTPEARRLTEAAAVLGRESGVAVLRHMTGLEESVLFSATDELLRRQVMEDAGDGRLRFVHDKIREVADEELSADARPILHRGAAEAIEAILMPEHRDLLGELGRHWEAAGERSKAAGSYLPAARDAAARYAHQEAERLYRAYLRLVEEPSLESIAARNELGENVLEVSGRNDAALIEHQQALFDARQIGARAREVESLRRLGEVHRNIGRQEEARKLYEQALVIAGQVDDQQGRALVSNSLALLLQQQGRPEEARLLYEQALAIQRRFGNRRFEGNVLGNLGYLHRDMGRMEEAQRLQEQTLRIYREVGDRRYEGIALGSLADLLQQQGRLEEARQLYEQALAIHRQLGNRHFEGVVLGNLASLKSEQNVLDEAQQLHEEALAIHRQTGDRRFEGVALSNLADVHQQQGRPAEAQRLHERALDLLRQVGDRRSEGVVLGSLADLHYEEGRLEEARQLYEQALDLDVQVGNWRFQGYASGCLANLELLRTGDWQRAEKLVEDGETLLAAVGDQLELGKVVCCHGHIALAAGRSGREQFGRAETLARSAGAGADSALGKSLGGLLRAVSAFEAGEHGRLFRGYLLEDLPRGVRRWLEQSVPGLLPS